MVILPDVLASFGLQREFRNAAYFETEQTDSGFQGGVEGGVSEGGVSWYATPRLPKDSGQEHDASGTSPIGGAEADRAQKRERLPALCDRQRCRSAGSRQKIDGHR
jgi:hypothetical protein